MTFKNIFQRNKLLERLDYYWIIIFIAELLLGLTIIVFPPLFPIFILLCIPFIFLFIRSPATLATFLLLLVMPYPFSFFSIGDADIGLLEVGVFIAFILWVVSEAKNKPLVIDIRGLEVPILILLGWAVFTVFWTPSIPRGLHHVLKIASSFLIYFLTVNLIKNKSDLEKLFLGWIIVSIIFSILGVHQILSVGIDKSINVAISEGELARLGKTVRVTTILSTPNDLGFFLMTPLTLLIIKLFQPLEGSYRNCKYIYVFIMFSEIVVLVSTFSRKSWLALGLIIVLISIRYKKVFIFSSIITAFAILVFFVFNVGIYGELLENRLASFLFPVEETIPERAIAWNIGKELFLRNPIIGNGLGSFFILSKSFNSPLNLPHNFYLFLLTELGLIGLFLFVFVAIVFLINLLKIKHGEKEGFMATCLFACLCAILFQSFFRTIGLTDPIFWAFLGLISVFIRQYSPFYNKT